MGTLGFSSGGFYPYIENISFLYTCKYVSINLAVSHIRVPQKGEPFINIACDSRNLLQYNQYNKGSLQSQMIMKYIFSVLYMLIATGMLYMFITMLTVSTGYKFRQMKKKHEWKQFQSSMLCENLVYTTLCFYATSCECKRPQWIGRRDGLTY